VADWFVVNLSDAEALRSDNFGSGIELEPEHGAFEQLGINVCWLEPGEPGSLYHAEDAQEAYLVLHGECRLLVEDSERMLRAWDFVHLPPGTPHALVGAGSGPSAAVMVGARLGDAHRVRFPVSETAARYGASVAEETDDRATAYAGRDSGLEPSPPFWPPGD
jgi:uncharacterized cupin superfamily protein